LNLPDPIGEALRWIDGGGLLAYPTETVWGLGVDAASAQGLVRLREWKGRDEDHPVAVLVESMETALEAGFEFSPAARRLASRFWPGPLTLIVKGPGGLADGVARPDGAVGLRCSSHPLAVALSRRLRQERGAFLTSTSLNHSGDPPARTLVEARSLCGHTAGEPLLIPVEGGEAGGGQASTVIDLTEDPPRVLRWGAVAQDELELVLDQLQ
jgi:L-threonylcarbamoyladenylate synthase